ncbi:hypothetical protein C0991_010012, partial [Blastosporella zonata]
ELSTFFSYIKASNSVGDIPVEIYDIRQEMSDVRTLPALITLQKEDLNGTTHYIIRTAGNPPFEVGLTSAVSILEIIRRLRDHDIFEICTWLLNSGISFKTLILGPRSARRYPVAALPHGGLGFRPPGYTGDVNDYHAYLAFRNRLLSGFVGRAALMAGGLVARLAYGGNVSYDSVFYGPSDNVFDTGASFNVDRESTRAYWDDCLTDNDKDVICGVYRVATSAYN